MGVWGLWFPNAKGDWFNHRNGQNIISALVVGEVIWRSVNKVDFMFILSGYGSIIFLLMIEFKVARDSSRGASAEAENRMGTELKLEGACGAETVTPLGRFWQ